MTDIIARLRAPYYWMSGSNGYNEEENDAPFGAADEIERLRARIAALEAAMAPLVALAGVIRQDAEKATKGPWSVLLYDAGDKQYRDMGGPCPSVQAPKAEDCAVIHWEGFKQMYWTSANGNQKEIMSNARLIAAAPDMSAAILAAADAAGGEG